jgi:hypothetical protein
MALIGLGMMLIFPELRRDGNPVPDNGELLLPGIGVSAGGAVLIAFSFALPGRRK